MKGRFEFSLVVLFFIIVGLGLALYKHFSLGFPLLRGEASTVWNIEARVEFNATGGPAQATLSLPDKQPGVRIMDQSFASPGYGVTQIDEQGQPRAKWSIRNAKGSSQDLFYKVKLHLQPDTSRPVPAEQPPEVTGKTTLPEPYQTAATGLLERIHERSADSRSFASTLINEFVSAAPSQNATMLLGMTETVESKNKLLIQLLSMSGIPTRLVRGLYLENGRRRQPIVDMLEVYTNKGWVLFNPKTGQAGTPEHFFLWQRGGKSLLDVMGGKNSRISFSIISQSVPTRDLALTEAKANDTALIDFSIYALPLEAQNGFKTILLVPIGTFIVLIMRVLVGLRTSGTFMPVLIAIAFLQTQLLPGLIIFITIVSIGLWMRSILSRMNMLLVARLSAIIIVVIGIMVGMSIFSWKLGISQGLTISFFPMIILAWTIERMSILWEEEGPKDVFIEGGGSLLVASICYLVMTNPIVEHLTFNFPELLLSVLGLTLLLGHYKGYRLLELRRFKPLAAE